MMTDILLVLSNPKSQGTLLNEYRFEGWGRRWGKIPSYSKLPKLL